MGTRSSYRIIEKWEDTQANESGENILCNVYLQYDGYPQGHPSDTAQWLSQGTVVNGLGLQEARLVFNGGGCLAAQFIARLKEGPGGTYLHSLESWGKCCEDYLYDIIIKSDRSLEFVAYENYSDTPTEIFRGTPAEFTAKYERVGV